VNWVLYVIAAVTALNVLYGVAIVGAPRKPVTPGMAAGFVVNGAFTVTVLVLAARQVHGW
jgi:hypothetical protein